MSNDPKISPAFEPFLAQSGANERRDAIVIYDAPSSEGPRVRGRIRALKQRLKTVEDRAAAQHSVQRQLFENYRKPSGKALPGKQKLATSSIGANTMPIATVEVTPKTLPALAEQPNVVAILPNQRIHLIRPKEVDFEVLERQEDKAGLTWGLKQLGIPRLWKTTRGKDINVAVLDTGVHGDHPALAGQIGRAHV